MTFRPSLTRSIPFWILVVGALVSALVGAWMIVERLGVMTTTLTDGTATGVEVYVGQSLVIVGAALLTAGILGLLLALALAAVRSLLPAPQPVVVEPIDWTEEEILEADASVDAADLSDSQPVAELSDDQPIEGAQPVAGAESAVAPEPAQR